MDPFGSCLAHELTCWDLQHQQILSWIDMNRDESSVIVWFSLVAATHISSPEGAYSGEIHCFLSNNGLQFT